MPPPKTADSPVSGVSANYLAWLVSGRREQARASIVRCLKWWLAGHAAAALAFGLAAGGVAAAFSGSEAGHAVSALLLLAACPVALAAVFLLIVPVGRATYVAFRERSVLPPHWIAAGLLPWLVISIEVLAFLFLRFIV